MVFLTLPVRDWPASFVTVNLFSWVAGFNIGDFCQSILWNFSEAVSAPFFVCSILITHTFPKILVFVSKNSV